MSDLPEVQEYLVAWQCFIADPRPTQPESAAIAIATGFDAIAAVAAQAAATLRSASGQAAAGWQDCQKALAEARGRRLPCREAEVAQTRYETAETRAEKAEGMLRLAWEQNTLDYALRDSADNCFANWCRGLAARYEKEET